VFLHGSCVALELRWSVSTSRGKPANTGSARPSEVSVTGRIPTSGAAPWYTFAPRLAASSWTPRHTPQNGRPASTASAVRRFSAASHGSVSSSVADIGPPGDDGVELAPVGKRIALVELDPADRGAALPQDVLVGAGRLARDVLEDERSHAVRA